MGSGWSSSSVGWWQGQEEMSAQWRDGTFPQTRLQGSNNRTLLLLETLINMNCKLSSCDKSMISFLGNRNTIFLFAPHQPDSLVNHRRVLFCPERLVGSKCSHIPFKILQLFTFERYWAISVKRRESNSCLVPPKIGLLLLEWLCLTVIVDVFVQYLFKVPIFRGFFSFVCLHCR